MVAGGGAVPGRGAQARDDKQIVAPVLEQRGDGGAAVKQNRSLPRPGSP